MQHEDQLLAQQQLQNGTTQSRLLANDQQRSVLAILDVTRCHHLTYTPYGHRIPENGLLSLLGFNGERPDPVTGHYLLGNGYRAFNPVLMRFNSPDSWSPFGEGGLNAYAYCVGDPVNQEDRSGHMQRPNTRPPNSPRPNSPLSSNANSYSPLTSRAPRSSTSMGELTQSTGVSQSIKETSTPLLDEIKKIKKIHKYNKR
jgi:RHS repeat-associated protein